MGAPPAFPRMQRKFARAVCAGVLAALAVLAVICVVNNEVVRVSNGKDLRGDALLRKQADRLDAARALKNKGKDMQSFDDMLHKFQSAPDKGLTAALVSKAPKNSDVDVALSPGALGFGTTANLPGADQLNMEAPKKGDSMLAPANDINFVQIEDYGEQPWQPKGQEGLAHDIKVASAEDEKDALKDDGLEGDSVLAAGGIGKYSVAEARDMLFVQEYASDDTGAVWTPSGQATLNSQVKQAKADALKAEKEGKSEDVSMGSSVLSSVGIKQIQERSDDLVPEIKPEDLLLAQVSASWVPQGQHGLAQTIKAASIEDEAAAVKADGLGGTTVLTAATPVDDEDEFMQVPEDKVLNWKPQGQKTMKGTRTEPKDHVATEAESTYHKKPKKWQMQETDELQGNDILSAVALGHHRKAKDDLMSTMSLGKNEFDAYALLKD